MRTKRERLEDRIADKKRLLRHQEPNLTHGEQRRLRDQIDKMQSKLDALPCIECGGSGLIHAAAGYFACGECDLGDAYADQAAKEETK